MGAREKLAKLEGKLAKTRSACSKGYESTRVAREAAIKEAEANVTAQHQLVMKMVKDLEDAQAFEEAARLKKEKEAQEAAIAAEIKAKSSDECLKAIVQCKLEMDKRFDGKKEKNVKVWPEVHAKYLALIAANDLRAEDALSLEAMEGKYAHELMHFRHYAKEVQRYKQSGASADDVDKIAKRCAAEAKSHQFVLMLLHTVTPCNAL